jgi:predicted AlkP superfamily pyrophosphatase or phosphodiesterase
MKAPTNTIKPLLLFALVALSGCTGATRGKPKLVLSVVLDQVRGDLLARYDSLFSGGFRRLHDEGFVFVNATHDHAKTATAVGHAAISTGLFPFRNGIVGNEWLEETSDGWRTVYSVEDTLTHILGQPVLEGRSPKNLLRGGLADWIVEADSGATIVSVSRKDRAAIAMAGKARGHVYWIPENQGQFATSSFYRDEYPSWVERFNREEMPRIFGDSVWEQTLPAGARGLSRPDTADYEGDGVHTFFPHRFSEEGGDPDRPGALTRWAYAQTHPDDAVGEFAMEAVRELGLGEDDIPDYLGISFSQADAIGHDYGPLSREQLENLLHLDRVLGDLMAFLDDEVGEGRWVMSVSADHGVLSLPEYLAEQGQEASRASREDLSILRSIFRAQREAEGSPAERADVLVEALEDLPFVADAMTVTELITGPPADSFVVFMRNSYHPDRWLPQSGSQGSGVVLRFLEAYYPSTGARGTGHGTPYYYDRYVPLIFFGPGVDPGVSLQPVRSVDIAPTLASLAGIEPPPDLDGKPLFR